jgi:hypothetical protein
LHKPRHTPRLYQGNHRPSTRADERNESTGDHIFSPDRVKQILEIDRDGVTLRKGDVRVLRGV